MEDAAAYVARVPQQDLRPLVASPGDAALMQKARLDCDWYAENVRCFAAMQHPEIEFLPARVTGVAGLGELMKLRSETTEECWLVFTGQQPQALGPLVEKVFRLLSGLGIRMALYAFDEASRTMACFDRIAPYLDVLIHDETPLEPKAAARLKPGCFKLHRSWVANIVPFAPPFNATPEPKILFLGSQLGLTEHRQRQIAFLQQRFKDRFVASHDHSIAVRDRFSLNRFRVGLCPEGRKFTTPGMSQTHTDRPFWSGCLGLVPVSEDSKQGGRLEELARAGLIIRYPHGDLKPLAEACERALELPDTERRRLYDHFNRFETVGPVLADAIAGVGLRS